MKPREFDDLIRQKFDQNEFGYNPRNWELLSEQLDGRAKKRSLVMWWWMPLAGVAASVALALGVSTALRQQEAGVNGLAAKKHSTIHQPAVIAVTPPQAIAYAPAAATTGNTTAKKQSTKPVSKPVAEATHFGINLDNAIVYNSGKADTKANHKKLLQDPLPKAKETKKELAENTAVKTFKPEEPRKEPKLSLILSGGISRGNQNNGYAAGATIRRMINDKVYVEGEIAFASSNNSQESLMANPATPNSYAAGKHSTASKTTAVESNKATSPTPVFAPPIAYTANYTMSYAQVAPSIGVKLMKKLSVAAGPDFQQALADNRPPSAANLTRENVEVMPLFDVGVVGKTEYALTKHVKAAVAYRKGINNVLTPMDKYIDRDYLQVQVRYSIFNR
jgi:hypothetical protein